MVQIDFSAIFDRVNHQGILFKLCYVGVGGSVQSVLTQFLSNRSQYVVVDGSRSKLVNLVSARSARGKSFGCPVVPLVHRGAFLSSRNALCLC